MDKIELAFKFTEYTFKNLTAKELITRYETSDSAEIYAKVFNDIYKRLDLPDPVSAKN